MMVMDQECSPESNQQVAKRLLGGGIGSRDNAPYRIAGL